MQSITGNFNSWSNQVFSAIKIENPYLLALDILLTAVILYWFLSKIIESKAARVLYGLFVIFVIYLVATILNLKVLDWMLRYLSLAILIAIPIIFHTEIRMALERMGGGGLRKFWRVSKDLKKTWSKEVAKAVAEIAASRQGGLIVIENNSPLNQYYEKGIQMNGEISANLIESVFSSGSNLKDGALVISKGQVVAAKVVLPIEKQQQSFGARHLAGIDITNETDALSIIISSTSRISVAWHGKLRQANPQQVRKILEEMWNI
jgi:diadenylate cyclase